MGKKTLVERFTDTPEGMRGFQRSYLVLGVTEAICKAMDEQQITRSKLADALGKTKGYVSQMLNGEQNLTLHTIADILTVLGRAMRVDLVPLETTLGHPADDGSER